MMILSRVNIILSILLRLSALTIFHLVVADLYLFPETDLEEPQQV